MDHGYHLQMGNNDKQGDIIKSCFISFCEGLPHERTTPDFVVISMISIALMGQDSCFDQGFIADSMLRVGFKSVCSHTLDTDWGPMDLDITQK